MPRQTRHLARFRLSTAAMDQNGIIELVRAGGEVKEREMRAGGGERCRACSSQTAAAEKKAKSKSKQAFSKKRNRRRLRAPARRCSGVSDLRASTQSCERACAVPLCGELEESASARDVPREGGRREKKRTSKEFFRRKREGVTKERG